MYVKIFSTWDAKTMEDAMNGWLSDFDDEPNIKIIDVKMATTYDEAQSRPTLYYTGIIAISEE